MKRAAPFAALAFLASTLALLASCTELGAWDLIADAEARLELLRIPTKRVTIDLSGLAQPTETLVDFPVMIRLPDPSFPEFSYADCSPDGLDVVFTAMDGTPLAHELEQWNPAGESIFWVKVPSISQVPASTVIQMRWDAEYPLDSSDPPAVWSNGYVAVFHGRHRTNTATGKLIWVDSARANDSIGTNDFILPAVLDPAQIGEGIRFAHPLAGFPVADSPSLADLGPMTAELWISDAGTVGGEVIFAKGGTSLSVSNGQVPVLHADFHDAPMEVYGPSLWASDGSWSSIGIVWDGDPSTAGVRFFEGGALRSSASGSGSGSRVSDIGELLIVGNRLPLSAGNTTLDADLDEIRISNVARSPDWMRAQYLSQLGSELSFGTVEVVEP